MATVSRPRLANRPSRQTIARLAVLAVEVLSEAYDLADREPIDRSTIHKLALGYLMLVDVTAPPQAARLWQLLGHEGNFSQMDCRQAIGGVMLDGMWQRARALAGSARKP